MCKHVYAYIYIHTYIHMYILGGLALLPLAVAFASGVRPIAYICICVYIYIYIYITNTTIHYIYIYTEREREIHVYGRLPTGRNLFLRGVEKESGSSTPAEPC